MQNRPGNTDVLSRTFRERVTRKEESKQRRSSSRRPHGVISYFLRLADDTFAYRSLFHDVHHIDWGEGDEQN